MSSNIFNKSVKELIPDIAAAIYDEIKVPRVGGQRIRVAGFTRDILEGIYSHLEKLLANKPKDAYRICLIAERAGKTVPITAVERVMEYRTNPKIRALVVFDPWKIEEYGQNLFLRYSFREFPMMECLTELARKKMTSAPTKMRQTWFAHRELFNESFPKLEQPLREALFAATLASGGFTWENYGKALRFLNAFPDSAVTEKNADARIRANLHLTRLFIHSRLPMNERVVLLAPKDRATAAMLLSFFITRDGVLPEFWLHEIFEKQPELFFDKWCSPIAASSRKPLVASFEGIGKDRRAAREITVAWEQPYGKEPYGFALVRLWKKEVVVLERVQRSMTEAKFPLDLSTVDHGLYQLQVQLYGADSLIMGESWSAPFQWRGAEADGTASQAEILPLRWLNGPSVYDYPSAVLAHIKEDLAVRRKHSEFLEKPPKYTPIPFPSGDSLQEVTLPDHVKYFLRVPELFRTLEKASLEDFKALRAFSMDLSSTAPVAVEYDLPTPDDSEDFFKFRKQFFVQIRRSGSSPCSIEYSTVKSAALDYLNSYITMLGKVLKSRAKVIRDELLFIDTVTLKVNGQVAGLLTLPTHPLEVAFRYGFQQLLTNAWQSLLRSSTATCSSSEPDFVSLRSRFSQIISGADGKYFVLVEVPHPGFSLYLSEGVECSSLVEAWGKVYPEHAHTMLKSCSAVLKQGLANFADLTTVSIGVSGITNTSTAIQLCRQLAESIPDPEVLFDITFYDTPAGVLERLENEIDRIRRDFCLYDLSADPEVWRSRFPFDRILMHTARSSEVHSHHLAVIMPNFTTLTESFESRKTCRLTFFDGLSPVNISFEAGKGIIQWSGAGPREDNASSDRISSVVEAIQDMFGAAASKISLQKTSAHSHLRTAMKLAPEYLEFLRKLAADSMAVICISLTGASEVMHAISPASDSVGVSTSPWSVSIHSETCPSVTALRDALRGSLRDKGVEPGTMLITELRASTTNPFNLYGGENSSTLLRKMLARKALSALSQTRDGILFDPSHYPELFKGENLPMLVLLKFSGESMLPIMVHPFMLEGLVKSEEATLTSQQNEELRHAEDSFYGFIKSVMTEGDGSFTWKRFGDMLAEELQVQCFRQEVADKDAEQLAENLNAVINKHLYPKRDAVTALPLLLLPDAKGQLMGRPFAKVHPLCRALSGEEIDQWIRK